MAYTKVKDRVEIKEQNPFFAPIKPVQQIVGPQPRSSLGLNLDTKTSQTTQAVLPRDGAPELKAPLGKGLKDTTKVLPGPRVSTLEAIRRGDNIETLPVGGREQRGETSIAKEVATQGGYIPVGIRIKIPFTQKGFTIPNDSPVQLLSEYAEAPEKLIKSAYYTTLTPQQKEAFKIKDEAKIFQSPLYQKDYKEAVDRGMHPVAAFALTGISAGLDALIFADLVGLPALKAIKKIPVTKQKVLKLTWEDLSAITRGEVLSNEKMAAFTKASEDGIDWIKAMKETPGRTVDVKTGKGKTMGEWVDEQYGMVKANQKGFIATPGGKKRKLQAIDDNIKSLEKRMKKPQSKEALRELDKAHLKARKEYQAILAEPTLTGSQEGFAKLPGKEIKPIQQDIAKAKAEGKSFEEFVKTQGKPVYHGTSAEFDNFDIDRVGTIKTADWGKGVYLTPERSSADYYRKEALTATDKNVDKAFNKLEKIEKTLKPKSVNDSTPNYTKEYDKALKEFREISAKVESDENAGRIIEVYIDPKAKVISHYDAPGAIGDQSLAQGLKADGYDVVKITQGERGNEYVSEIVVMNPKVLKTKPQLKQLWDKPDALHALAGVEEEDGELKFDPLKAGLGMVAGSIVKRGGSKKVPKSIYKQNQTLKRGVREVFKQDTKALLTGIKLGADKYLGSISTRLKNIDPELKRGLRNFEYKIRDTTLKDTREVKPFLDATKKMSKEDALDFDLARKNGDVEKIKEITKKYGIEKEYNKVRDTLNSLHKRATDVGYNIGYLEDYHPRIIKDKEGFLNHFKGRSDWNIIDQAIKTKENAIQRQLTDDEKVLLVNTMIRGYRQNAITLSEIGNMKTREIDLVDAELNQFYMGSNASLTKYIEKSNEAIEARKFFGKGRFNSEVDVNDSIGSYVLNLIAEGKIKPEQEIIVSDILKARFNAVGTRGPVSVYKNLSYIDTMGSPTSAITQIGDLAWSLYKGGVARTTKNFIKASVGKSNIKKEDIGIDNIAQEFDEPTKASKAVSKVFKLTGLEKIDAVGKETLINSVINKYQTWATKGDKRLEKALEPVFGKEKAEVIADLKSGDITENVKLLAFNELLDMQPVALSEMPQKYLTGGNGRLFYMLKTFTLKQFDIYRNEIFQLLKDPKTRAEGLRNMVKLISTFVIMNATADEIKDFMLGRKTSLKDRTVDNILRAVGFSKYLTWKARTEGVGSAAARQILPPFKFIDSVSKDITQGIENGSEVVQSIPLAGKLYYWWFGKGATKNKARNKDATRLEELEERIDSVQKKSKLQEFEDRIKKIESK